MGQEDIRASVMVSTRNRSEKLRLFLDAMKANALSEVAPIEVLVIDNNSSDATKQVVERYTSLGKPVFRYLLQTEPGKSRALNAALREARGEIIAFTDDDCIPSPGWIKNILNEFESDAQLSVLGGRVELYDKEDVHQAVVLSNHRTLVTDICDICTRPIIIGANMAFRKSVLKAIQGFDPLLGPGTACRAAEDIDLIYRSVKKKYKVVYSPTAIVLHNHGRRSEADENQTSSDYAIGRGAFYLKNLSKLDRDIGRVGFNELCDLGKTLMKGVITRKKFPYHRVTLPGLFVGAAYYCRGRLSWG
jgi:cellulose synthase/poly-beta-1,6-N-acetylglucosamine synthase-like glycosyltransferase